jgi:O-antigen ligase
VGVNRAAHAPLHGQPGPARRTLTRLAGLLPLAAIGVLFGVQYVRPDKRVLGTIAGALMLGVAWRLSLVSGLGLLTVLIPYPRGTSFGSTTLAFILVLLVIWLLRAATRQSPGWRRTSLDAPIVGLLLCYLISFYKVDPENYLEASVNTELMFAGALLFYLIVSNLRDEKDLKRLHVFQLASLGTILALSVYELGHPGSVFIPGWISFIQSGEVFATRGVRIGGPFFDYELMSEFSAVSTLMVALWMVRARTASGRTLLGLFLVVNVFIFFATVTRGAMVSLGVALLYLAWLMRRQIRFVPFTIVVSAVVSGFIGMNFFVANFTRSGDLFIRFEQTKFHGLVPDTRVETWALAWQKFLQSPIIGHGPYYVHQVGTTTYWWPHCGYLYVANLVGAVGLSFFLWIMVRLWLDSRPGTDRLDDPSYARAYLLIAHVQLVLFIVDQTKIDFLRNGIYQFQIWLLFANIAAASRIAREMDTAPDESGTA